MTSSERGTLTVEQLTEGIRIVEAVPRPDRDRALAMVEARFDPSPGLASQVMEAMRREDYGVLYAFALTLDIPTISSGVGELIRLVEAWANDFLRWRGQDPATMKRLPRPSGAPLAERRLQARVLLRYGMGYRDAAIGLWWAFAPGTVNDLRVSATQATRKPANDRLTIHTEAGARDWLATQGRGMVRSIDRAWHDVHGRCSDLPGLKGFSPLTRLALCEWPDDALSSVREVQRRTRR